MNVGRHFLLLPDIPLPSRKHCSYGEESVICHYPSRRPFLIASGYRNNSERIIYARSGTNVLAIIGFFSVNRSVLVKELSNVLRIADFNDIHSRINGCFYLVAYFDGLVRVQGNLTGLRRIFYSGSREGLVVSNRADVVAGIINATFDDGRLALKLLDASPYPIEGLPLWKEVVAVSEGDYLAFNGDGSAINTITWWTPPESTLSIDTAAPLIKQAVERSIDVLAANYDTVSCDLSGGLDSTPLFLVAAERVPNITAFTVHNADPADDDLFWVQKVIDEHQNIRRVQVSSDDLPGFYDPQTQVTDFGDDPSLTLLSFERHRSILSFMQQKGSKVHMNGLGGDQLFTGVPAVYHDLLREQPSRALQSLLYYRALYQFSVMPIARVLMDGSSFSQWLNRSIGDFCHGRVRKRNVLFDWGYLPNLPFWATSYAKEVAVKALEESKYSFKEAAPRRGIHADLAAIRNVAHQTRVLRQAGEQSGVETFSPFLGDEVMNICLSVRPEERNNPRRFKPLAKSAFANLIPQELHERISKTDGSLQAAKSFLINRERILTMFEDSALEKRGLIDGNEFKKLFAHSYVREEIEGDFSATLYSEIWLNRKFSEA